VGGGLSPPPPPPPTPTPTDVDHTHVKQWAYVVQSRRISR
jgi:hypothetical protein